MNKSIKPKFKIGDKVVVKNSIPQEEGLITEKEFFEGLWYCYNVHFPRVGVNMIYDENSLEKAHKRKEKSIEEEFSMAEPLTRSPNTMPLAEGKWTTKHQADIKYKKDIGERNNAGKPKYSWIPMEYLEEMIKGLEFGAMKYSKNGWKKGFPLSEIIDSLYRHCNKILSGEFIDEESGLSHFGLIQCNALFLANPNNINDVDLKTDYYRKQDENK